MNAQDWIAKLELAPHPEGGYFAEHYRCAETSPTPRGERNWCTGIYYLLDAPNFSRFHRLAQADEMWHAYAGSPGTRLHVHMLHPDDGRHECLELGSGAQLTGVVPAGVWFAAELAAADSAVSPQPPSQYPTWFLAGCTVSPGFDFADFEIAERGALLKAFPRHAELIRRLTHV